MILHQQRPITERRHVQSALADQNPNPTNAGRAANTEQKTRTGLRTIINTGAIVGKSVGAISIFIGLGSTGEAYRACY